MAPGFMACQTLFSQRRCLGGGLFVAARCLCLLERSWVSGQPFDLGMGWRRSVPVFDPEAAAVDPSFVDPQVRGHAIAPQRLTTQALRKRFSSPLPWQAEQAFDGRVARPQRQDAAVLLPLLVRPQGVQILLTQRAAHLRDHAGQISFPGGRLEACDADATAAALRECREEVGVDPSAVEVLGLLPQYVTATGYRVTPVVGLIEHLPSLAIDTSEVERAFEVPLTFLMDPAHHERRMLDWEGAQHRFFAIPYDSDRRYFIWGATAAMLRNLYRFLSADA